MHVAGFIHMSTPLLILTNGRYHHVDASNDQRDQNSENNPILKHNGF